MTAPAVRGVTSIAQLSVTGLAYREGDAAGNATLVAAVRDMAFTMATALGPEVAPD